jgi:hypothetical protein
VKLQFRGILGAHGLAICRKQVRTGEITIAGQPACRPCQPSSATHKHKTWPTGRLACRLHVRAAQAHKAPCPRSYLQDPLHRSASPSDLAVASLHLSTHDKTLYAHSRRPSSPQPPWLPSRLDCPPSIRRSARPRRRATPAARPTPSRPSQAGRLTVWSHTIRSRRHQVAAAASRRSGRQVVST